MDFSILEENLVNQNTTNSGWQHTCLCFMSHYQASFWPNSSPQSDTKPGLLTILYLVPLAFPKIWFYVQSSTSLHLISDKMPERSQSHHLLGSYIGPIISVDLKLEAFVINFIKMWRFYLCTCCNNKQFCSLTDAYEPLSRVIPISKNKLTPYRAVIIMRLIVLGLFFHYRITNPVNSAFGLWMTSVICEIWFGFSWILDQFPKWYPINRETYVDRLTARYVC
jgi:hypothetical protein